MIKKTAVFVAAALALGLTAGLAIAADDPVPGLESDLEVQQFYQVTQADGSRAVASVGVTADLPEADVEGLLWMVEEEKLAHDVYVALYDVWGVRIFDNISSAETTHMDAIRGLLDVYGIDDPTAGNGLGEFTEPAIQELYDDLVAQGSESVIAALEVGAFIEELDILDLQDRASEFSDIQAVYANLERGSRNHLRAFVKNLDQRGVDYAPELMSLDEFESIISSQTETGRAVGSEEAGRAGDQTPEPRQGRGRWGGGGGGGGRGR